MKIPRIFLLCALMALFCTFSTQAQAALKTRSVIYSQGNTPLEGYVAYDTAFKGKRPLVLIAHQWMGLTDYEKRRAQMLAHLGYVAFAMDIYGKGIRPANNKEAGIQAGIYRANRHLMRERARAALITARKLPNVDTSRIAAIGYCFGGGVVLELARSGAQLNGVVTFHGSLDTPNPADAKNIKARILVLHGAADPLVNQQVVMKFWDEMNAAHVDWQFVAYGHAVHAFSQKEVGNDPSQGVAYNEKADKRSWEEMKQFFKEIF